MAPPAYYAELAAQRGLLLASRGAGTGGVDDFYCDGAAVCADGAAGGAAAAAAGGGGGVGGGAGCKAHGAEAVGGGGDAGGKGAAGAPCEVRVHPRLGGTMHYL